MKLLAVPIVGLVLALVAFPVVFATGDNPGIGCAAGGDVAPILATIRTLESGGDYTARAAGSSASGAYQFIDSTWAGSGGYAQAWQAPPAVQDAKAAENVRRVLDDNDGDVSAVPVVWYIGHLPGPTSPSWDQVPVPSAGNVLTPRQYQQRWLAEYDRQLTGGDGTASGGSCAAGEAIIPFADGYAIPGPADLFATAPVDEPHHTYPAWDWMLPTGTPIYAAATGVVISTTTSGACGIGAIINGDDGAQYTYCHGNPGSHAVATGDAVTVGQYLMDSASTGNSTGPHLHFAIKIDGQARCPQPLLVSIAEGAPVTPASLPTSGCSY